MATSTTKTESADTGDYLKVAACTAVILQSVLTLALKQPLNVTDQWIIGLSYNAVKFTAPAFIFGILFTTTRTTYPSQLSAYPHYLKRQWSALFIPSIFWTTVYLLGMPQLQQGVPFHSVKTFAWQFVNGNAAPHLWYNTMMLQFILLMPLFWWLARIATNAGRVKLILLVTLIGCALWVAFYDVTVWHGPHQQSWVLLDRVSLSFAGYAILGTLAARFSKSLAQKLAQHQWLLKLSWFVLFGLTTGLLIHAGLPIHLNVTSYIQPAMVGYDLATIGLIVSLANTQIHRHARSVPVIHWLAIYAYRAYLANVFWLQLIWALGGRWLAVAPLPVIIGCYVLTWICSFASAYGLHRLVQLL